MGIIQRTLCRLCLALAIGTSVPGKLSLFEIEKTCRYWTHIEHTLENNYTVTEVCHLNTNFCIT